MRKTASALLIIGMSVLLVSVLFVFIGFGSGAIFSSFFALFLVLFGLIVSIIAYKENAARWIVYNDRFREIYVLCSTVMNLGAIVFVIGVFFRLMHWHFSDKISLAGILIGGVAYVGLLYLVFSRKKYLKVSTSEVIHVEYPERYTGVYFNDKLNMEMRLFLDGETLHAQLTGQKAFPLSAVKNDVFNYLPAGVVMEFHLEKGEFILIQHGMYLPFIRR